MHAAGLKTTTQAEVAVTKTWSVFASWLYRDWVFVAAILVGAGLRLYQLGDQIIADDEWHALHAARDLGFREIAAYFGAADISIPMALFYKALANTFGLSEMPMRAPVVLSGMLAVVILPLLVRKVFDRPTATLFGWLLAISPIHVYFSRYARPYAISLFFATCGIYAFYLWWTTRIRYWKYLYIVCAIVGPYFHLTVLPALFAPLAVISVQAFWGRTPDPEFSRANVLRLILITAGGFALLLAPPIWADFGSLAEKAQHGGFRSESFTGALGLFVGMEAPAAQALTLAVMTLGAFTLLRKQPRLALLLGTAAGAVILAIVAARPLGIDSHPITLARYALFLLPVMILVLAIGLRRIGDWLGAARPVAGVIWATWMIFTFTLGPISRIYYAPNNFTNHALFQYYPYFDERNAYTQSLSLPVPPFYFELGRQPASSLRIIEAPWVYAWHYNPYPLYQGVHRQRVVIGFIAKSPPFPSGELPPFDRRFRFSNFVHLEDRHDVCAHRIDRLVFHKDLRRELNQPDNEAFPRDLARFIPQYRRDYGPPVFEDDTLVVFDLTAACHDDAKRE